MSDAPPVDPTKLAIIDGHLSKEEVYWRDHQKWLLECGYRLRPRYDPNWIPSWKRTGKFMLLCEDSQELVVRRCGLHKSMISHHFQFGQIIDAVRIQDGMSVALKNISKSVHPYETNIGKMFSAEPLVSDPRNRCVPILGALQPPDDDDITILVMPLLHAYDEPSFDTVGEVIDFFEQIFKVSSLSLGHSNVNLNDNLSRAFSSCMSIMLHIGMHNSRHASPPATMFISSEVTVISATS
jgi:hypothetical protein